MCWSWQRREDDVSESGGQSQVKALGPRVPGLPETVQAELLLAARARTTFPLAQVAVSRESILALLVPGLVGRARTELVLAARQADLIASRGWSFT